MASSKKAYDGSGGSDRLVFQAGIKALSPTAAAYQFAMGTLLSCIFDEDGLDEHERERLNQLQQGKYFKRKVMVALGVSLGSEQVVVRLSEDQSTLSWRTVHARGSPTYGDVKVTNVESVKPIGATGLVLMGKGQTKELELEAEDAAARDTWVIALSEVVERSKATGKHSDAEKATRTAEEAADKRQYWSNRRQELRDQEKAAAERKQKYANTGMQFTARAMAGNRAEL